MSEDQRLLREFVDSASRTALEELIRRHLALVYSAALRQARDPHLAEDISQAVFLVLTEKARTIRNGQALGGWLLAVTRSACVNAMKKQAIQRKHEALASRPETAPTDADEWAQIAPLLDGELNRLAIADRDAIVLRFFQDRSFSEIGREMQLSEEAARKRVTRALERLRAAITRRKPSISLAALSAAIATYAVQAAPGHVVAGTIAASIASPTPQCLTIAKGATKMIAWTKAKLVSTVAASLLAGGTSVVVVKHVISNRPDTVNTQVATPAAPAPAVAPQVVTDGAGTLSNNDASVFTPAAAANTPANDAALAAPADAAAVPLTVTGGTLLVPMQGGGAGSVGFGAVMMGPGDQQPAASDGGNSVFVAPQPQPAPSSGTTDNKPAPAQGK
jgi:RNA polymerase sigma factor (sigma-70 family)